MFTGWEEFFCLLRFRRGSRWKTVDKHERLRNESQSILFSRAASCELRKQFTTRSE